MTISAVVPDIAFAGSSGSGTLGPFSLIKNGTPIVFYNNSEVYVYRYDAVTDTAPTLLVEGTDYTLTGSPASGSITLTSPQTGLLTAERLYVYTRTSIAQALDLVNGGNFPSAALERRLDIIFQIIQQLDREVRSGIRFAMFDTDEIPKTLPLNAAIDKIPYVTGTASAPVVAYLSATVLADLSELSVETLANIAIVAADLASADTIGIVAADLDSDDNIGTVAASIADVNTTADWINAGQFGSAPVTSTGSTTARTLAARFAEVFHVDDYGAVPDGTTNSTTAIQAAIDACEAAGGGQVIFSEGVYIVNATLVIDDHNVHLRGQGSISYVVVSNWRQFAATTIKWNGSAGGTVIQIKTPTDALHVTQNCDIQGILVDCVALDGTTRAGKGVEILSLRGGTFSDVCVYRASAACWNLDIATGLSSLLDPSEDLQSVLFERCIAYAIWTGADGADGWRLGKDNVDTGTGNVSLCTFMVCEAYTYDGTGWDMFGSDSNIFSIRGFVASGGSGYGVEFNGGTVANKRARGNILLSYIGNGGIRSVTGTEDPDSNFIVNFSEENGPSITDIAGKPIWRQTDGGGSWLRAMQIGASAVAAADGVASAEVGYSSLLRSSIPANPPSGALTYHDDQGRTWTRRGNGLLRPISSGFGRRNMEAVATNTAATTFTMTGAATIVSDGTATGIGITSTNSFTRTPRVQSVSTAATGANAGFRIPSFIYPADNFLGRFVFGWETFQTNAAAFIGMKPTGAHGNADPTSFIDCFGMAISSGQTTWRIIHNDGSGTATEIDLGANFPANTSATDLYSLLLWWSDGGATLWYQVNRVGTSNITSGSVTTNLPTTTSALNPNIVANTRTGSSAISLSLASCNFEVI